MTEIPAVEPKNDREEEGEHVLKAPSGVLVIAVWHFQGNPSRTWTIDGPQRYTPEQLAARGYSYVGIFTPPDEVEHLQERVEELEATDDLIDSDPRALVQEAYYAGWRDSHWARKGETPDDADWRRSHVRFRLDELLRDTGARDKKGKNNGKPSAYLQAKWPAPNQPLHHPQHRRDE